MGSILPQDHQLEQKSIGQLAASILDECSLMEKECQIHDASPPSLVAGANPVFWSDALPQLTAARTRALGLLDRLAVLLQGPHDYLHELVASNWDHGALYAFLQSKALEHIATSGRASLASLSKQCGIPEDKLVRILALCRCRNIVDEVENSVYGLTAVSEAMLHDRNFTAWVEFQ